MDLNLDELILCPDEVAAVKFIHHEELAQKFRDNDPDFVPCNISGPYGQLFDIVRSRYGNK
jgi:hypothetical protein